MFGDNNINAHQGTQFQPAPAPMPLPSDPVSHLPGTTPGFDSPLNSVPPAMPAQVASPPIPPAVEQPGDESLIAIKQDALASLTPLVGKIDQTPEEKFKTTMMLIQASDNASLIKEAYATANQIPDEKARAQALIDVINEINYFTQKHDKKQP